MATIAIQLDPAKLRNPDLDIRYELPDLLSKWTSGRVVDSGYDYAGAEASPCLLLLLSADNADSVSEVIDFLKVVPVLGNDLSRVAVALEINGNVRVVHPHDFSGTFHWSGSS